MHQDDACGSTSGSKIDFSFKDKPWYGNNAYLYELLEAKGMNEPEYKIKYRVPVKFWIYRDSKKRGGPTDAELKDYIKYLNYYYGLNKTGISFYLYPEVGFINSNRLQEMNYKLEAPFQTYFHRQKGSMNVLLVKNLANYRFGKTMKSYYGTYNTVTKVIILRNESSSSSLSHEVGHFFGLNHPHLHYKKGKKKQESVSRTRKAEGKKKGRNCEHNGDKLCDTPAEPMLSSTTKQNCKYIKKKGAKDNWGDPYKPDVKNIMSYTANRECRDFFTKGQVAVMLSTIDDNKYSEAWSTDADDAQNYEFDSFEPDNSKASASEIFFNTRQAHTFHKTFAGFSKSDIDFDTDWLYFNVTKKKVSKAEILILPEYYKSTNLKVNVYNSRNKKIKSISIKRGRKGVIKLTNLKRGKYYIEVVKIQETSHLNGYKIEVKDK